MGVAWPTLFTRMPSFSKFIYCYCLRPVSQGPAVVMVRVPPKMAAISRKIGAKTIIVLTARPQKSSVFSPMERGERTFSLHCKEQKGGPLSSKEIFM